MKKENLRIFSFIRTHRVNGVIGFLSFLQKHQ